MWLQYYNIMIHENVLLFLKHYDGLKGLPFAHFIHVFNTKLNIRCQMPVKQDFSLFQAIPPSNSFSAV